MTLIQIVLLGLIAGVTVGAPFGPSGTYCLYRSVQSGKLIGLVTALGSVLAIFFFSFLAGIFLDSLAPIIQDEQVVKTIRLITGLLLLLIGVIFILKSRSKQKSKEGNNNKNYFESFLSAFGLGIISGKNLIGFPTFLIATQYISENSIPLVLKALIFGVGSLISSSLLYYLLVIMSVRWGTVVFSRILPLMAKVIGLLFFGLGLFLIFQFFQ